MPRVSTKRTRGATVVVTAYGEALFAPGGPVPSWTRKFSNRVRGFTIQAAPTNKRPRWAHYGVPLKRSIHATTPRPKPGQMRVDSAVFSTASHAIYVDQGTRDHEAVLLPPWDRTARRGTLYEATWRPAPGKPANGPIHVRGIRAQGFFATGLARAFAAEGMPSVLAPEGPEVTRAFSNFDVGMIGFAPGAVAFHAQLAQWREWRREAWTVKRDAQREAVQSAKHVAAKEARRDVRFEKPRRSGLTAAERNEIEKAKDHAKRERLAEAKRIKAENTRLNEERERAEIRSRIAKRKALAYFNKVDRLGVRALMGEYEDGSWWVEVIGPDGTAIEHRFT